MARFSNGRGMVRMDPDAARAPIWRGQDWASDDAPRYLHSRPCSTKIAVVALPEEAARLGKVRGGLTPTDQRLLGEVLYRWQLDGCRADREVRASLRSLAASLWPDAQFSGERDHLLKAAIRRLHGVAVMSVRWDQRSSAESAWRLLDRYDIVTDRGRGSHAMCRLSTEVAGAVATKRGTLLPLATWDALRAESEVATILWTWLCSERLVHDMSWRIFNDGDGNVTPVAVRLGLFSAARRYRVLTGIRAASAVVMRHDPTLVLEVLQNEQSGRWTFRARRVAAAIVPPSGPLPKEVMASYRAAYDMRRPSASQVEVLVDLMAHLPGESDPGGWVARELQMAADAGHPDPLKATLDHGHDRQRAAAAATEAREKEWAEIKAAESASNGAEGWRIVSTTLQQIHDRASKTGPEMSRSVARNE